MTILVIGLLVNISWGYRDDNDLKITYVGDSDPEIESWLIEAKNGAIEGGAASSWIDSTYTRFNPSESYFNSYLYYDEFVFFAGHGTDDVIGGTESNGFSNNIMHEDEIDSGAMSKVVTIFACSAGDGSFGETLTHRGVHCSVGWSGTLAPDSDDEAFEWSYYFYKCGGSNDADYCEYYASYKSGLWGSGQQGDCDLPMDDNYAMSSSLSMDSILTTTSSNDKSLYIENLSNGYIKSDFKKSKIKTSKSVLSQKKSEKIVMDYLQLPKDYQLEIVEDEDKGYTFVYNRYFKGVKIANDEYAASINKYTGEIYFEKKTHTDNLEKHLENIDLNKGFNFNNLKKLDDKVVTKREKVIVLNDSEKTFINEKYYYLRDGIENVALMEE